MIVHDDPPGNMPADDATAPAPEPPAAIPPAVSKEDPATVVKPDYSNSLHALLSKDPPGPGTI